MQCLLSKPDKYVITTLWVSDAKAFCYKVSLTSEGKEDRENKLGRNTAINMTEPYFVSERYPMADNHFMDMVHVLSSHLLANNIVVLGMVRDERFYLLHSKQERA